MAPFLQGDMLVLVGVTLLKEARYAVLHGHQGSSQRRKFRMCQDPVRRMLIQFVKLPVHRIHIHVVVFLKVPQEKFNGVVSSQESLFIQVNFLDFASLLFI